MQRPVRSPPQTPRTGLFARCAGLLTEGARMNCSTNVQARTGRNRFVVRTGMACNDVRNGALWREVRCNGQV